MRNVTPGEVYEVFKKRTVSSSTAPGMDGVPAYAWKRMPPEFLDCVQTCFTQCLRQGVFP